MALKMANNSDAEEKIDGNKGDEDQFYADEDEDMTPATVEDYYSDTPLNPQVQYPPLDDSFHSALIVTNLPRITEAKVEKLLGIVTKIFSKIGTLATSEDGSFNGVHMPFDKTVDPPKSCGFAFVQYTNPDDAKKAVTAASGYVLDKAHTFSTMLYSDAIELRHISSQFVEPEPAPYVESPNLDSWLLDESQRDSFVVRHGQETSVYWFEGKQNDPVLDYDGKREKEAGINWCDFYCHWSPKGRYLATLIPAKGVVLWGSETYEKLGRIPSPGVQNVLFSPQEKYLLTSNENRKDPTAIKIFDLQTQTLLRSFPMYPQGFLSEDQEKALRSGNFEAVPPPPLFQWSHDDKYIARMGKGLISIYDLSTMKLLDKRSLNAEGIHEFQWSPKDNIIAYWAPEVDANAPAHVDLVEIPSRKFLRQKNLFNVTKCSMAWQSEGDFLGVKVTRHTKSKKTLFNNFELFRIRDAGIPVEMLEIKDAGKYKASRTFTFSSFLFNLLRM
jgi:translation initiation factor 3 subunit B